LIFDQVFVSRDFEVGSK